MATGDGPHRSTGPEVKPGAPLQLAIVVSRIGPGAACTPVEGAHVDLWQCDASGIYSGVRDPSFDTTGQQYLRGFQRTDATGTARFSTIYPGWYRGRTVHVHFKVRTEPSKARGHEFTSQIYFDDAFTDRVYAREPYAHMAHRTVRNEGDGIFVAMGTSSCSPSREDAAGYAGTFTSAADRLTADALQYVAPLEWSQSCSVMVSSFGR